MEQQAVNCLLFFTAAGTMAITWGYATLKEQGYFTKTHKDDPEITAYNQEKSGREMQDRYAKILSKASKGQGLNL